MANARKVLLVGWDAADWTVIQPLLDRGEVPVLAGIVEGGVSGELASLSPLLAPVVWTSLATGKRPDKHGVHGCAQFDPVLGRPVPVSSATRRCRALWQILNQRGLRTHVVGWPASHPAEPLDGVCVSERFAAPAPDPGQPWPPTPDAVAPASHAETLAELRVRPEELPGDVLRLFVPRAAEIDQSRDKRLHVLAAALAATFSTHAAATALLAQGPWDFAAVHYGGIGRLTAAFMGFHPPRMPGCPQAEFDLYHEVVRGAYRLHDALLGRLLQLAGQETTVIVVSAHGFHSGHRRPGTPDAAGWRRHRGVLAWRGAGLRADELLHGASLLDIAPTVLALLGLPTGRDMDGRVLAEAFNETPAPGTIETWEPDGRSAAVRPSDDVSDADEAAVHTQRTNDWNLARSYLDAGRPAVALPLLEGVYAHWPERWDYCLTLGRCQLGLGLLEEATETAAGLAGSPAVTAHRLLLANIAYERGQHAACLEHLAAVEADNPALPILQLHLGRARALLRQWGPAEAAFRRALELDADAPGGYLGLAQCHLHGKRAEAAAEAALHALGLRFDLPQGHFLLGVALARMGDEARARQAFETCLHHQPRWRAVHRFLAVLHARRPDGQEPARRHREQARARDEGEAAGFALLARLRHESAVRARQRGEARARRRAGQSPVIPALRFFEESSSLATPTAPTTPKQTT